MERRTKNLLVSPNIPPADPALSASIRPYQNSRRAVFVGFKDRPDATIKDGEDEEYRGIYILTRFADSAQVHYVARPMAMREQLTYCDEPVKECYPATAAFREAMIANTSASDSEEDGDNASDLNREGHVFVFGQDSGGDENTSYYLHHSGGQTSKLQLHDEEDGSRRVMHHSWAWNNNQPYAAFVSNARDRTHFDLYLVSAEDVAQHVRAEQSSEQGNDVIPTTSIYNNTKSGYLRIKDFDHNHLLVQHYTSVTDSRLYLFTLDENDMAKVKSMDEIGGGEVPASVGSSAQIIGGREKKGEVAVAYSSDRSGQYKSLPLWAKSKHMISHEGLGGIGQEIKSWDVECLAYNQETGDLVAGYNEDGSTMLYHWRHGDTLPRLDKLRYAMVVPLNGLGMGVVAGGLKFGSIQSRSPQNRFVVGFSFVSPTSPADAYILERRYDPNLYFIQYTKSEIGGLDSSTFGSPSLIRYKSFDGLEIPAFVYRPNASRNDSCKSQGIPVLIHPHGGPEGQHRPTYSAFYQFLMNKLEIAIIDPNVRGSNGYGKTFVSMDNGRNREDSVKDIGSLIEWIEAEGKDSFGLDPSRIAVWGGSYGGYMCLATLIHFNDKLKCGIDMVGISNFVTFLENTASYRRILRRVKYGDESDPEMRKFLNDISPLTKAGKIRAPLFVCQGKNDPRVPVGEAEQIYKTVKDNGLEAWYMLAENEGHGFRKKENIDQYQNALVQFLQKHLIGESY